MGEEHVNPDDRDFAAVVTKVKSSGAEAVYYGGEYPASRPALPPTQGQQASTSR